MRLLALVALGGFLPLVTSQNAVAQTISKSADGFDLPVSPPNGAGFYKSRGFKPGTHLGEDWVTDGGSAKGFRLPVHAIGNGIVVLARDIHVAWGNVVIVRHAWIEEKQLHFADSLYAHLDRMNVREGQQVGKGQQIGAIGTNHGMYPPHLHFEIHKDLGIGVNHSAGHRDLSGYWIPTEFVMARRHLAGGGRKVPTPTANFLLPTTDHPWKLGRFLWHRPKSPSSKSAASSKSSELHRSGTSSPSHHSTKHKKAVHHAKTSAGTVKANP